MLTQGVCVVCVIEIEVFFPSFSHLGPCCLRLIFLSLNQSKDFKRIDENFGTTWFDWDQQYWNHNQKVTTDTISQSLALLIRLRQVSWSELSEFRADIDNIVTVRAAQRVNREDIVVLDHLLEETNDLVSEEELDWQGFIGIDRRIHLTMAKLAGNSLHEWVLKTVLDDMFQYLDTFRVKGKEFTVDMFQSISKMINAVNNHIQRMWFGGLRPHRGLTVLQKPPN